MISLAQGGNKTNLILFSVVAAILAAASVAFAQSDTREIVSTDFTKNRPAANESPATSSGALGGTSTNPAPKARVYRPVSKPVAGTKGANRPVVRPNKPAPTDTLVAQLGITMWRLRAATSADGKRQLIREKAENVAWAPERIEANTLLNDGDRVRISIESPRAGYLYIVDRDLFSGGREGEIKLIFPFAGEDNYVAPGHLVELPALDSEQSYFTARPKPYQVGEMLTLIVTSKPLNLPLSNQELPISRAQLSEWERVWGGDTEIWEMEGGAGEAWTVAEQQAAAKKGTRQLTRTDPAPQTIYRISTSDTKAMLVNVRLRYVP